MNEERKPILTICPDDFPGVKAHLKNYLSTGLTEHTETITPSAVIGRKMVIFGAWHPVYYEAMQKIKSTGVPIALLWTSSVGQIDFVNNGIEISFLYLLKDLIYAGLIDILFTPTEQIQNMFQQFIEPKKVILLPHSLNWNKIQEKYDKNIYPEKNDIDLFSTAETRKNILPQIHASKLADCRIYLNHTSQRYIFFADILKVKYTSMGWIPDETYFNVIQQMKMGLQVTYAESFNYVVAEHFAMKRPCLISPVMGRWVDNNLWKDIMIYNIDNPFEIADVIMNIKNMSDKKYNKLGNECFRFIKKEAKSRNDNAIKILTTTYEELNKR